MPRFSIISPVYNQENYIKQCLESVLNQNFKDFELILVNDGSTDNSPQIINDYALKDDRIKIINKQNEGQGIARNVALKIATGDYVLYLDPDDWLESGALEKIYNKFQEDDYDIIFFNFYQYFQKTNKKNKYRYIDYYYTKFKTSCFNSITAANILFDANGLLFKAYSRRFLVENDIKYSPTKYIEDSEFFIKSVLYAKKMVCLDEIIANYRIHDSSSRSCTNENIYTIEKTFYCCENIVKKYIEQNNCDENAIKSSFLKNRLDQLFFHNSRVSRKSRKEYFNMFKRVLNYIEDNYDYKYITNNINNNKYQSIKNDTWFVFNIKLFVSFYKVYMPAYFII